jgi:hypothetical protein
MNEYLLALGGGLASAKVLEKFLGPTAEYLGEGMRTRKEARRNDPAHLCKRGG